tara:strand:- start:4985 stop:5191 length:207 start_codon:yes stop_codon:yes gene_type:complete
MNLIEEQIKAYENMINYLLKQIERLERKSKVRSCVSKNCDGKIFTKRCCFEKPKDRIYLKLVNKRQAT